MRYSPLALRCVCQWHKERNCYLYFSSRVPSKPHRSFPQEGQDELTCLQILTWLLPWFPIQTYPVLHRWIKLGGLTKLLTVRLMFYHPVAQLSPLGASPVGRDVALEGDETSTPQEIAKIIKQGLVQECFFLTNSKMLYCIQHILQHPLPTLLFFF